MSTDDTNATRRGSGSNDLLGQLPPMRVLDRHLPTGVTLYGYNAADMRAYAAQEVAAERERCARLADEYATWGGSNFHAWFTKLATAIRA